MITMRRDLTQRNTAGAGADTEQGARGLKTPMMMLQRKLLLLPAPLI